MCRSTHDGLQPGWRVLVSDTTEGKCSPFLIKHSGHPEKMVTVLDDLNAPHGMAFQKGKLYGAEPSVRRYDWDDAP